MKLSGAISLGAMLSPQAIGKLEDAEGSTLCLGGSDSCDWTLGRQGMEMGEKHG
jgi:hypothetical protein